MTQIHNFVINLSYLMSDIVIVLYHVTSVLAVYFCVKPPVKLDESFMLKILCNL